MNTVFSHLFSSKQTPPSNWKEQTPRSIILSGPAKSVDKILRHLETSGQIPANWNLEVANSPKELLEQASMQRFDAIALMYTKSEIYTDGYGSFQNIAWEIRQQFLRQKIEVRRPISDAQMAQLFSSIDEWVDAVRRKALKKTILREYEANVRAVLGTLPPKLFPHIESFLAASTYVVQSGVDPFQPEQRFKDSEPPLWMKH